MLRQPIAEPAVEGTYKASSGIKDFFQRLFALRQVDKDYEELKSRVAELELQNQLMENIQTENQRLIELLGFVEDNPQYKYISAQGDSQRPGQLVYGIYHQPGDKRRRGSGHGGCQSVWTYRKDN